MLNQNLSPAEAANAIKAIRDALILMREAGLKTYLSWPSLPVELLLRAKAYYSAFPSPVGLSDVPSATKWFIQHSVEFPCASVFADRCRKIAIARQEPPIIRIIPALPILKPKPAQQPAKRNPITHLQPEQPIISQADKDRAQSMIEQLKANHNTTTKTGDL